MTNKTKIIIAVLLILAVGIAIYGIVSNKKGTENTSVKQDELSNMMDYFDDQNNSSENTNIENENNAIENNTVTNDTTNQVQDNSSSKTNTVIGKEEQESSNENTSVNDESKAIELAKKEWGISVDSYDYDAELQSDGTYIVTVRNKSNDERTHGRPEAVYVVNVKAGTATER